jgi:hypothetical protein
METTLTATMYRGSQPAVNMGTEDEPVWRIIWKETVGGETTTQDYVVEYEWFKNETSISSGTNEITVSLAETETVCKYRCEATLTRVEAGGSK